MHKGGGRCFRPQAARLLAVVLLAGPLLSACTAGRSDAPEPLLESLPSARTHVDFVNQVREQGGLNVVAFESFYNGAGVGIGDFNGDGRPDLFLASNMGASRLFLNEGDFEFRDVTRQAGIDTEGRWANGVATVDINHDGHLDVYVSCGGPYAAAERRGNLLYVNNGDGTFAEKAQAYGLADTGVTTQAAFFDYDNDGDLDVYLLTNGIGDVGPNVIVPKKTDGRSVNTDRLYRNDGTGRFTDVSREAGILTEGYGLGVAVFDVNRDGWQDVYAANDYLSNDVLYVNNADGTFTDRAAETFRHQSYASMGTDAADFNNDGLIDIVTVDMLPATNRRLKMMYGDAGYDRQRSELEAGYDRQLRRNTLQLNNGALPGDAPTFSDVSYLAGVSGTGWSWSSLFADVDNDGLRDLLVTNGLPRDVTNLDFSAYKMHRLRAGRSDGAVLDELAETLSELEPVSIHNYIFRNDGDLTFSDKSFEWGFRRPSFSTGAAFADLDDDGDLDLVVNNVNAEASVFKNNAREQLGRNYLKVRLEGPAGNPAGLGTQVSLHTEGRRQFHEHSIYRGYLSSSGPEIHFGLGAAELIDSIVVKWPDGKLQTMRAVRANQTMTVRHRDASDSRSPSITSSAVLFEDAADMLSEPYEHSEQHYNDFRVQPLLPHKYSQNGPGLAVGDVDGDGRDDFYVGGAFGQRGQVYLQDPSGLLRPAEAGLATAASGASFFEEDMGSLFFDADGDGHLDLYVVSGGSEFEAGSKYYQDRLYVGDGTGKFVQVGDALPEMTASGSVVAAADVDRDGDQDLFVGGRVVPNAYPIVPRSYLLENRGGTFVDVTDAAAPSLRHPGLVTSALWSDFDDDGWTDLIVAGEWMPISFYANREGRLVDVTEEAGTAESVGWWNSLAAGDFDRDGDIDYVAGNLGRNTNLRNTSAGPVRAHVNDFNRDGRVEAVFSRYLGETSYPVHLRDDLIKQHPSLVRRFPAYADYAEATIDAVVPEDEQTVVLSIDTFESSVIENEGGTFAVRPLPVEAQLAPVFGILTGDYDGDGALDILMIGNSYAAEAFVGPYDAFSGLLLRGDTHGSFSAVPLTESGILLDGDGKALVEVAGTSGQRLILAAQNNGRLRALKALRAAHVLRPRPDEVRAEIRYDDGRTEKVEFYLGAGYLSQSSRTLYLSGRAAAVRFYGAAGPTRVWESDSTDALAAGGGLP